LSFKNWKVREDMPPVVLHLNISEFCNANCRFCISRIIKGKRRTMEMGLYLRALEQYRQMGGKEIVLNPLVGEPLTDPELFCKIDPKIVEGLEVSMFTNGILLSKNDNVSRLLDSGVSYIHVSLAAFDKKIHAREMGVDCYDEVKEGIIRLLTKNEELGKPKRISFEIKGGINNLFTKDFISDILPLVDSQFVSENIIVSKLFDDWIGALSRNDLGKDCGFKPRGVLRRRPCYWPFSLTIMTSGLVRACGCRFGIAGKNDALVVGDLNKATLETIWKSNALKKIRRAYGEGNQIETCRKCRAYWPV